MLVAAVDCCCWLLLLIAAADFCCWLLMLTAAQKLFEYFRNIVGDLRLRQFAGKKVFEYFRVFGGKSLNISRILMGEKWKRGSPRGSRLESE